MIKRLLLLLLIAVGCVTAAGRTLRPKATIEVNNDSMYQVAVYVDGSRVGTVMAGQRECIDVSHVPAGTAVVLFDYLALDRYRAPDVQFLKGRGFTVTLTNIPYIAVLSLVPSELCS